MELPSSRQCPLCGEEAFSEEGYSSIFRCKQGHLTTMPEIGGE